MNSATGRVSRTLPVRVPKGQEVRGVSLADPHTLLVTYGDGPRCAGSVVSSQCQSSPNSWGGARPGRPDDRPVADAVEGEA